MKAKEKVSVAPPFLSGWKEIANYLGKGVRTVQRYERDFGLPVRRPAGKPWGSVVATKPELDGWIMASPIREGFHLTRLPQGSNDATAAIKNGLDKMNQLRDQMMALRAEVKASVQLLRKSVHGLQGGLNQNRWYENTPMRFLKDSSRKEGGFELSEVEPEQRKVS